MRQAGACDSGYACAYQNNISWRNENTPMPPLFDPRLVFERLFTNNDDPDLAAGRALRESCRGSILDLVRDDARALQAKLGATDRRKVDQYQSAFGGKYPGVFVGWSQAQPYYRVRVGGFTNRTDATKFLQSIKGDYPDAYIVADRVKTTELTTY